MPRYFINLSFDGTRYHGWQVQPEADTVQGRLHSALATILRQPVEVVGAGRTDAGVHAQMMVAHVDLPDAVDADQLAFRLNRLLPPDIAINDIHRVPDDFHARFSAKRRTYHYFIHTTKQPLRRHYSAELRYPLDFDAMNTAAEHLLHVSDFGAFCKSHTDVKTTLCDVYEAQWQQVDTNYWCFTISANRFLRNMVRAVVGTLIEVGRHRITLQQFDDIVAGKDRCAAGESMPAHALFLDDIEY